MLKWNDYQEAFSLKNHIKLSFYDDVGLKPSNEVAENVKFLM